MGHETRICRGDRLPFQVAPRAYRNRAGCQALHTHAQICNCLTELVIPAPALGSCGVYNALLSAWFGGASAAARRRRKPVERHSNCVTVPAMRMKFLWERKQL